MRKIAAILGAWLLLCASPASAEIVAGRFNATICGPGEASKYLGGGVFNCVSALGGGGTPAGSSGDIQTNSAGSFGALTPGAGVATFLATPIAGIPATWLQSGAAVANLGFTPPPNTRAVNTSGLLTGGGNLTADRTITMGAIAANTLIGNPTGSSAAPTTITLGANLSFSGGALVAAGGGSVTTTDGTNSVTSTTTQTFNPASFKISGSAGSATIDLTSTSIDRTGSGQAIVAGDAGKTVLLGAFTYTLAQAGTSGFEAGYGTCLLNSGAANATLTSTTSVFSGASGSTSLTIQPGVMACPQSDGTNYQTLLTTSTKGIAANLPLFSNGSNGLTAGTRSGNTTKVVTSTGTLTSGNCAQWDASGNAIDAGAACGGGGGSGTVTSGTASQVPRYSATGTTIAGSSILTNDNSIVTASGAFALSGTNTPTALAANQNDYNPASLSTALALRVDGGAADRTITGLAGGVDGRVIVVTNVGTSNYLTLANASASSIAANRFQTTSDIILATNASVTLRYDGTSSRWRPINRGGATPAVAAIGWVPTVNPDKLVIMTATVPTTVLDITGTVVTGVGAAAALTVYKAPSGTVCASGTAQNTGTFDANGTAATNQTLTLAGGAANTLAPGDRLCLSTADGAAFTAGTGNGGITVRVSM